jgi:hypothetical protein
MNAFRICRWFFPHAPHAVDGSDFIAAYENHAHAQLLCKKYTQACFWFMSNSSFTSSSIQVVYAKNFTEVKEDLEELMHPVHPVFKMRSTFF